ncbi:MAG: hypothetical protein EA401_12830 [Planctomycetota bacterium]|nr:MAG: hypothetical protein EA401_12830 [Planctomycetota bacterium]
MPTVQDLVKDHMAQHHMDSRQFAERCGVNQMTISSLISDGSLPRKAEHRENIREVLGLDSDTWADALMASSGYPIFPDDEAPLQYLIAYHMFRQGMTERALSLLSGIPYGTIMGLVRKGAIPRGNSLNRIGDALGLEPSLVAAATQRSGGNANTLPPPPVTHTAAKEGLAPMVARRIRNLGLSMGAYAEKLGLRYFQLSRFLDSGTPPQEPAFLQALRDDLELDDEAFSLAIETGSHKPRPGTVSARKGQPPPDASLLQQALIAYMNTHRMTIKALAQKLSLSQITVSRLVKHGTRPSRSRTHAQLRQLLELTEDEYGALLAGQSARKKHHQGDTEALTPKSRKPSSSKADYPESAALTGTAEQNGDEEFYATDIHSDMSDKDIMHCLSTLTPRQRAAFIKSLREVLHT